MKTLGLSKKEIAKLFDKRGLKSDYGYLSKNKFDAFFPSKNIQERFIDIAKQTNQPNPLKQAFPVIKKMFKDFLKQDLKREFNLKLEDYLPQQPKSMSQAPLPPQPMPSQQVIQPQQMTTAMGLTPTEMSLLSPEEKQLRLRQRGLV